MRRTALLFLTATLCSIAGAQDRTWLDRFLNGDPDAPPDHDTAYISNYRSNLVVSAVSRYQFATVDMDHADDRTMTWSTNGNEQYGFGIDFKWLSAELTFNVPAFSQYDATLGKTDSRSFGLGYTSRRLWVRGFWNDTKGFYMDDTPAWTGSEAPYVRPDMRSSTYLASANYALSGKRRFSQNAAIFQMERQKRSAGTFVLGASVWRNTVQGDSSLMSPALLDTFQIATGFNRVKRTIIGIPFGYTHTFSFWRKGFIHAAFLAGPGYMYQEIRTTQDTLLAGGSTAGVVEMKLGAGFNGDRWYAATTVSYYYSSATIAENGAGMGMSYGFVRIAVGLRFGPPGLKVLRKVGL